MPAYNTPQRPSQREDGWPTRADIRYDTDAERLCRVLVGLVDVMGASVSLTRAVTLLGQAREAIADHVERIDQATPEATAPEPKTMRWLGSAQDAGNVLAVVAWINANDGEARYEPHLSWKASSPKHAHPARIVITGPNGPIYAKPGDTIVKGHGWFEPRPHALSLSFREFTVSSPEATT